MRRSGGRKEQLASSSGALLLAVALASILANGVGGPARAGLSLALLGGGPVLLAASFAHSLGRLEAVVIGAGCAAALSGIAAGIVLASGASASHALFTVACLIALGAVADLYRLRSSRRDVPEAVPSPTGGIALDDHSSSSVPSSPEAHTTRQREPVASRSKRAILGNGFTSSRASRAAGALTAGQLIRLLSGVAFWTIAARAFPASEVGLAAAAVAALLLCTQVALLGAGSSVIRLYTHETAARGLLAAAFKVVFLASLAIAGFFVLITAFTGGELSQIGRSPVLGVAFVGACVFGASHSLANEASVATGRPAQIVLRALALSAVMLILLGTWALLDLSRTSEVILSCWTAGELAACVLLTGQFGLRRRVGRQLVTARVRDVVVKGVSNHALTMADRVPPLLMTLVISEMLSPELSAYWYTLWMAALSILIIPMFSGTALFAQLVSEGGPRWSRVTANYARTLGVGAIAAATLGLLAGDLLGLLGDAYAANGERPLRILVAGIVPATIVQTYFAVCRSTDRLLEATATALASGMATVALGTWLGREHGLEGIAAAWLGSQFVAAIWAFHRTRHLSVIALLSDVRATLSGLRGEAGPNPEALVLADDAEDRFLPERPAAT